MLPLFLQLWMMKGQIYEQQKDLIAARAAYNQGVSTKRLHFT
jgi:hypothetical protein